MRTYGKRLCEQNKQSFVRSWHSLTEMSRSRAKMVEVVARMDLSTEQVGDAPAEFLAEIDCADPKTGKHLTIFLSMEDAADIWRELDSIRRNSDTAQRFVEALHKRR